MKSLRRLTMSGGTFAILAMAACFSDLSTATSPVLPHAPLRPTADIAPAPSRVERACVVLTIRLKNKRQDGATISPVDGPNCASGLRIVLADTVQYIYSQNVVRVAIVLQNDGARTLSTPARLYGWTDSLTSTANGNGHDGDFRFIGADGHVPAGSTMSGADFWSYDTQLAAQNQPQSLSAGARSKVRWIEIGVPHNPKEFIANLQADAYDIPATPIIVIADSMLIGSPVTDTAAYVGDEVPYSYSPRAGYTNVQVRIDGRAASLWVRSAPIRDTMCSRSR